MMNTKSPFKLLDPYQKGDRQIFFGRDKEISELYDFINKNRIVLVYGQSGTGKTSLIMCGLANEFESTDWIPVFVRRGNNINESLEHALIIQLQEGLASWDKEALHRNLHEIQNHSPEPNDRLIQVLQGLTYKYLRPIYLIFDQF